MVNISLAEDYLRRAKIRFTMLDHFMEQKDYADVVREAQEIVELCQKALLIKSGIQPPKWHDVTDIILENKEKFPEKVIKKISSLRREFIWLRGQRELAFYGDMDFIPLQAYGEKEAKRAIKIARQLLELIDNYFEGEWRES